MKKIPVYLLCFMFLASCTSGTPVPTATNTPIIPPTATVTNTPMPDGLWITPGVPSTLRTLAGSWNIPAVNDAASATQVLAVSDSGSAWIYALVAPFPTVTDDILYADLISTWQGVPAGPLAGRAILMDDSTLAAFTAHWGAPASGSVRSVPADQLMDTAWGEMPAWAIIPFEEIQPKWKVLSVDGQSPIHNDFNADTYQLRINFSLSSPSSFTLPETNRDPAKLTTVVLTGVTALVRATALTMEMKGITYPGTLVGDWLREADIAHISNEVTFDPDCGYPKFSSSLVLCSDPKYMDLLLDVGTDIVEVTGDHLLDRGMPALTGTLEMYKEHNLPYYGGGVNAEEARQPVLMEVNGNKIAFMGCNGKPVIFQKATDTTPGPAECDYAFFGEQIRALKAQGYMVIFTFQHNECYSEQPCFYLEEGFHSVADAGATVVSGSQAHFPHIMAFRGDAFIHYGLGNLFFDQMRYILPDGKVIDGTRLEFLDRHVFYDGRYLGVELLTAMLEDYARPRPMTPDERAAFLLDYFYYSGFIPFSPTPVPQPTVTLTPIALP
jgi:hypothetical protein